MRISINLPDVLLKDLFNISYMEKLTLEELLLQAMRNEVLYYVEVGE